MVEQVETVVIGGGQAGLSASYYLTKAGHPHVVLDRGNIGDTWRKRWDSFCLVTPNWCCNLPGFGYQGNDPNGFMLRDQIVAYVEHFAQSFDPPYQAGVTVTSVGPSPDLLRYAITTDHGDYRANNVIVTVGTHQHPKLPAWSSQFPPGVDVIHTRDYNNPDQFAPGNILVVGSGQSGCQIAEDLMLAGRTVHIACGRAGRILRRYRGREIIEWESMAGSFEIAVEDHPKGPDVRFVPHPHLTGRDGGKTIDLRQMALDGAILHGRLLNIDDNIIEFAHDLGRVLDDIDDACQQHMTRLDKFITEQGIDAPENTQSPANWVPNGGETRLDITAANITSVIMATGFQFDFSWLDLPIFDDRGYPRYRRGVTELPGVYFCGLHWMHTAGSGLFSQVGRDAEHVTAHLLRSG